MESHTEYYANREFLSFPSDGMYPWLVGNREDINNPVSIRRVASEISGIDDGVGEILATLSRLSLDEQTLVVFAADQGRMGGQNGLWGIGSDMNPVGAFDPLMHVPLIFRHPGRIPAGRTSDLLVSNCDFLPSVLGTLGLSDKLANAKSKTLAAIIRPSSLAAKPPGQTPSSTKWSGQLERLARLGETYFAGLAAIEIDGAGFVGGRAEQQIGFAVFVPVDHAEVVRPARGKYFADQHSGLERLGSDPLRVAEDPQAAKGFGNGDVGNAVTVKIGGSQNNPRTLQHCNVFNLLHGIDNFRADAQRLARGQLELHARRECVRIVTGQPAM